MSKRWPCASLAIGIIISLMAAPLMAQAIVIAHRGASGYLPEHTFPAIAMAHAMGADYLEPDVVLTQDRIPIVLHDIHLEATTDVAKKFPERMRKDNQFYAIDFTLAEIKTLNAGERINTNTNQRVYPGRFPETFLPLTVPTLEEYILLVQGLNKSTGKNVGIYPELKAPAFHTQEGVDIANEVLPILEKYGYVDEKSPIFLQCFDPTYLKELRLSRGVKLKMTQLIGPNVWQEADCDYDTMISSAGLAEIARYANGIGIYLKQIKDDTTTTKTIATNPNILNDAKNVGLLIHVYTLRQDELPTYTKTLDDLHELLFKKWNVDGVFTDFTDLTVRYLSNQ